VWGTCEDEVGGEGACGGDSEGYDEVNVRVCSGGGEGACECEGEGGGEGACDCYGGGLGYYECNIVMVLVRIMARVGMRVMVGWV
jgi:hypothetical protein